jgi:hypothetical protein
MIGMSVMGGKGRVGRTVGWIVLGASETGVGALVGVITSGDGELVGKGISDGIFVGLGFGRDGIRVGRPSEGLLVGATGNGVGSDVGEEVMLPSDSWAMTKAPSTSSLSGPAGATL